MQINTIKNTTIPQRKQQKIKNNFLTSTVIKGNLKEDTISFKGYDDRINAKKARQGWWRWNVWGGEENAIATVIREMKDEIHGLNKQIAVQQVELEGLEATLHGLRTAHAELKTTKQSQITALGNTESDHEETITSLNQTIKAKDDIIRETEEANRRFQSLLDEQNRLNANLKAQNEALREQMVDARRQNDEKLLADLEAQRMTMTKVHEAEMEGLLVRINAAARVVDPLTQMLNTPKAGGFKTIAGYQEQKEMIINSFGKPVVLEKCGKPAEVPNGLIFFGPKGCGKTAFARAAARQFDCQIVEIPCSLNPKVDIQNLRVAAAQAKEKFESTGKRTILLIDEFEKFAPKDSKMTGVMKSFMDNVSRQYHCTVFATTRSPEMIDNILLRVGRFDKICIPHANRDNILSLLKHYTVDFTDGSLDYDKLADKLMESDRAFSNAQIKTIMQRVTQKVLTLNLRALGSDISQQTLTLFRQQIEHVRHL